MLLTVEELVKIIRSSVNVQVVSEDGSIDTNYLAMTDDDIKLYIKLAVTRAFPDVEDLEDLENGSETPIILLTKMELYMKLAILSAPKVDMGADINNYLKQSQKFEHYMSLAKEVESQYKEWLEKETNGANMVRAYDVLISSRHYSSRNYEKQKMPEVKIKVAGVTKSQIDFQWKVLNTTMFSRFIVYLSESKIFNKFSNGGKYSDKIEENAQKILETSNIHNSFHSVVGLKPNTTYYIAVISLERNGVFGVDEISFSTLEE